MPRGAGEATTPVGPYIEQSASAPTTLHPGDDIYVNVTINTDGTASFTFFDYQRATPMWILTIAFVGAVLLLGRLRGLGALAGLAASLLVIVKFLLPSILDGNSPVMVAIVTSSLIAFIALYLAHGVNVPTSVALLGTFASLAVTALLSLLFVGWSNLTGLSDESALFLTSLGVQVDLQGIVLAGFVIGALGVLDDVTVTQVSAVEELHSAQPNLEPGQLYRSAVDHRPRSRLIDCQHALSCLRRSGLTVAAAVHPSRPVGQFARRSARSSPRRSSDHWSAPSVSSPPYRSPHGLL